VALGRGWDAPRAEDRAVRLEETVIYQRSAAVYDAYYGSRFDYAALAGRGHEIIAAHAPEAEATLLEVACGTGAYLVHLRRWYAVEGVDLSAEMLAVARAKLPEVPLHQGDMAEFDLGRRFGALVCLFSSIGYARTVPRLRQTVANLARHTRPGGVVLVGPWFSPEDWEDGRVMADLTDHDGFCIARMSRSGLDGSISTFDVHWLVSRPESPAIEYVRERHEMGLFTDQEYRDAFAAAGLAVWHDPVGLIGRGLYVGVRRQS